VTYSREAANATTPQKTWRCKCGFTFSVASSSKRLCPCTWGRLRA